MNLKRFIKIYDDALSKDFCDQMVSQFEHQTFNQTGPAGQPLNSSYIGNDASHWTEMNIDAQESWHQYTDTLIENCHSFSERYATETGAFLPNRMMLEAFRIKRYKAKNSDNFSPHIDADCIERAARYLVYIWYLSDVERGGETKFFNINYSVKPKKGRLLIFPPYWLFPHAGKTPISGDKYIVGNFLKFSDSTATVTS